MRRSLLLLLLTPTLAWAQPNPRDILNPEDLKVLISPRQTEALQRFRLTDQQGMQIFEIVREVLTSAFKKENPREGVTGLKERVSNVLSDEQWRDLEAMQPTPEQVNKAIQVMEAGNGRWKQQLDRAPDVAHGLLEAWQTRAPEQQKVFLEIFDRAFRKNTTR